ncbi:ERF family protein [Vagococcus intermedius]|uniref:ERF family protein n=1 Tax=Vagococcus intermedius TaxID=2991418 RepID=A0AAF0CWN8_9ENTE|nr:ERF family protein [Vagococcus intermedius]WEG74390.1 ERF family protein [Vagococcus intermedius]WEG76511.1 ERF family protein [Vagococcus intermedius]
MANNTVIKKIGELKKSVPYIQKQQKDYIKFAVVQSSDVLTAIRPKMDELGLILETHVIDFEVEKTEIGTNKKNGKLIFSYLIKLKVKYVWINEENPLDREAIEFVAIADDENSSYAYGQALTYAEKTFILKQFNIPTDDVDPDIFQKEVLKRVPASEEQIAALHILVNELKPLTGQTKKVIMEQAKATAGLNMDKNFEEYTAHDFGLVSNIMNGWVNAYKKKAKKAEKEKRKEQH